MEKEKKYLELTDSTFTSEVLEAAETVLVDFTAEWCGPCKMMAPAIEQLAEEYGGKAKVGKMDADLNPVTISKYGVRGVPTLLFFKNGEVVDKIVGAVSKREMEERLKLQLS